MNETEIRAAIGAAIRSVAPEANLNGVKPGEDLREVLDIDSFDFLKILIALHEQLGVDIPEADYGRLSTLESLSAYLLERCRK